MKRNILALLLLMALTVGAKADNIFAIDSVEVEFDGINGMHYGGTLTFPKGKKKSVGAVIVSGSGAQDRNGMMAGRDVFRQIAHHLSEHGIAVLRVDDRGVGKTNGVYSQATTKDFADDALAAFRFMQTRKEVNRKKTGLIGHSEGGAAITIAAAECKDVAFLVSVSGIMTDGLTALIEQNIDIVENTKGLEEFDKKRYHEINDLMFHKVYELAEADSTTLNKALWDLYDEWKVKDDARVKAKGIEFDHFRFPIYSYAITATSPWYRFFVRHNPAVYAEKVRCPVLAINGTKDVMVRCESNLNSVKRIFTNSKSVTTHAIEGINHILLPCERGTQDEYRSIKEPIPAEIFDTIWKWILAQ